MIEAGTLVPYTAGSGDTLAALAARFNTTVDQILLANPGRIADRTTLAPGLSLLIPASFAPLGGTPFQILPDSQFVNGPARRGQDTRLDLLRLGGYLTAYSEFAEGRVRPAWEIVDHVALAYSVSPRLLLAALEFRTGAATDPAPSADVKLYPLGLPDPLQSGLYSQLRRAAEQLNAGYYGWRSGALLEVQLADGRLSRADAWQNAATVGVQALLGKFLAGEAWEQAVGPQGFAAVYRRLFGDPWLDDFPLMPGGLEQPDWPLPFAEGKVWNLSGGPHPVWGESQPWAALDLAPPANTGGCVDSFEWVQAVAPGVIARSADAAVVLDLDGDGDERTGWNLLYYHVATQDRAPEGRRVAAGDPIGHPSCEGGRATGTHVHVARKYNGEWLPADGAIPFTLSGWMAHNEARPYLGSMTRGDQTATANPISSAATRIWR